MVQADFDRFVDDAISRLSPRVSDRRHLVLTTALYGIYGYQEKHGKTPGSVVVNIWGSNNSGLMQNTLRELKDLGYVAEFSSSELSYKVTDKGLEHLKEEGLL